MKTFAASLAVWGALALAGLYFGLPTRLLYWSGVALVVFWIVFATVWLFRQTSGVRRPGPRSLPLAEQGPEDRADQDREDNDESGNE